MKELYLKAMNGDSESIQAVKDYFASIEDDSKFLEEFGEFMFVAEKNPPKIQLLSAANIHSAFRDRVYRAVIEKNRQDASYGTKPI